MVLLDGTNANFHGIAMVYLIMSETEKRGLKQEILLLNHYDFGQLISILLMDQLIIMQKLFNHDGRQA